MPSRPMARGLRWAELLSPDPVASVAFYRRLLGWEVVQAGTTLDCWVGERRCATVRTPRAGERTGWRPVFAGGTENGVLVGPDGTTALIARGRALHGPWAPDPRPGELCWIELSAADPERADAFWADTLDWSVCRRRYLVRGRPLAGRTTDPLPDGGRGWLCCFAVRDVAAPVRGAETGERPELGGSRVLVDPQGAVVGIAERETWGGAVRPA
ncbi:VOC family protein [Saccharopolyspora rosea]|uniref:VOC family protein n=1 Tax=Saccharopolyspora rosea TaxID=524884 RepID=A0ABW3FZK9_9PSEU|nr:hypothetical protein [Saccharopolyspora rosea]